LKPDFLVLLNSPAILHRSTISRLSESIFKLLEQRLSVHLKLSPLQDYGIRQSRSILTLVASPVCASLPWQHEGPINGPRPSAKVEDIISDLAFVNPRARQSYGCRLVCNSPNSPATNMPIKAVYNHQTGRSPLFGVEPANLDLDVIALSRNSTETLVHPSECWSVILFNPFSPCTLLKLTVNEQSGKIY
jgi:hypothetical protein